MEVFLISYGVMNKNKLKFHVESHIPIEYRGKIFCDKCKFVSFSAQSMRSHRKYKHSIDVKKCVCHCGKAYSNFGHLNAHVKYVHDKIKPPKTHLCSICKRGFINPSSLKVCFYL